MAESTFVQLRIDNNLKQDAIDVLDEISIDNIKNSAEE